MLIRTLRRSSNSFRQLFTYIRNDRGASRAHPFVAVSLNIPFTPSKIIEAFKANDRFRKLNPRATTTMYHEIVAFSPEDTPALDPATLRSLLQAYLRIRCPNALAYAQVHYSTDSVHAHFLISGTDYRSPKTLRMDNANFRRVKREIEAYQREHFPHLRSVVYDRKPHEPAIQRTHGEIEMERRTGRPSQKSQYARLVQEAFESSGTREQFLDHLKAEGLAVYERNGKIQGLRSPGGKKYRFRTLGIDSKAFCELDQRQVRDKSQERARELQQIVKQLEKDPKNIPRDLSR